MDTVLDHERDSSPHHVEIELTILMPCLNEAETIGTCIRKAKSFLDRSGIRGEVIVADNGSSDGSEHIARSEGALVVPVSERGYGAALLGGLAAARGKITIMGDADDSYDFANLDSFVEMLRKGYDLVLGNRFLGRIDPGAMPFLNRYFGNPLLSFIGRCFFGTKCRDFHCGIRGFNTERIRHIGLQTQGMEFASEMIVRAALARYRIEEVPTRLKKDGRSRPPHLRPWRDGWRHLRFLLLFSPRWLFLYPGSLLVSVGVLLTFLLVQGPFFIADIGLDVHSLVAGSFLIIIGMQSISFGLIARRYAAAHGFLPRSVWAEKLGAFVTLERLLLMIVLPLFLLGFGTMVWSLLKWAEVGFGPLEFGSLIRTVTFAGTFTALSIQIAFTAFLYEIVSFPLSSGKTRG